MYFHVLQAVSWGSSYEHYGQAVQQLCPGHPVWLMELQARKQGERIKEQNMSSAEKQLNCCYLSFHSEHLENKTWISFKTSRK